MGAKFVACEYVPPGFEMVIVGKEAKAWNLWWNVKLIDDPEAWDSEIKSINRMQGRLGDLTSDQRLIRAQMAEFCRFHPLFPRSVDILCEEIGHGHFSRPVGMGCEGRGLLDSLGYHDSQSLDDQQKEIISEYAESLEKWLARGRSENPRESKVFGFLGQQTNDKEAFVEKLVLAIKSEEPPMPSIRRLSEDECRETHGELEVPGLRPLNCFNCPEGCSEGASVPNCQCCCSMLIDAGLLCVGKRGEERSVFDELRRFVEENVLAYSIAVNSWLEGAPPKRVTSLISPLYIADRNAPEIAERVHSLLGEKDKAKEWLVACLLKTIKDNQRWHKRAELIDDFPEASSWLLRGPR